MATVERVALSRQEVAEALGVSAETVKKLMASGEIESFTIGARRLVTVAAVKDFVERRQRRDGHKVAV